MGMQSIRAFTVLSRSGRRLAQSIHDFDISLSSTSLFCLSTPQSSLQAIFDAIANLPSTNLGCISTQITPGFPFCISFLNVPASCDHRIWRSTITGTEKAQVGRWYSREQMSRQSQDAPFDPLPPWSSARIRRAPRDKLPSPLQELVDDQRA